MLLIFKEKALVHLEAVSTLKFGKAYYIYAMIRTSMYSKKKNGGLQNISPKRIAKWSIQNMFDKFSLVRVFETIPLPLNSD